MQAVLRIVITRVHSASAMPARASLLCTVVMARRRAAIRSRASWMDVRADRRSGVVELLASVGAPVVPPKPTGSDRRRDRVASNSETRNATNRARALELT